MNLSLIKRYRLGVTASWLFRAADVSKGNRANSWWSLGIALNFVAKLPYCPCFACIPRLLHSCRKTIVQRLNPVRSPVVIPS